MAEQRVIRKSLAGEEDILLGKGKVTQSRNGADYEISRINVAKLFDSAAEMVADASLTVSQTVEVNGAVYKIVTAGTGTADGVNYVDLATHQAQLINPSSVVFNTVADLTVNTRLTVGQKVRTLGYYTEGDGGGNDYEIIAAATSTDDGGSYIDLATHQAKGLFGSIVDVKQYGAKGDNAENDSVALANAFATGHPYVFISAGTYLTDQIAVSNSTKTVKGAGVGASRLVWSGTDTSTGMLSFTSSNTLTISDFSVDVDETLYPTALGVMLTSCTDVTISNLRIGDAGRIGIYASNCTDLLIDNCHVSGFVDLGIQIVGASSREVTINNCEIIGAGTVHSIQCIDTTNATISNCYAEGSGQFGVNLWRCTRGKIIDNSTVNTIKEGINIQDSPNTLISGNRCFWSGAASTDFGISLWGELTQGNCNFSRVSNNIVSRAGKSGIALADQCSNTTVTDNHLLGCNVLNESMGAGVLMYGSACVDNVISNNTCYDGGTLHKYGVNEWINVSGAPNSNLVTGNKITGAVTDRVNLLGPLSRTDDWINYTPVVTATVGTITSYTASGRYRIVDGHTCEIQITTTITDNGTGSGAISITMPIATVAIAAYLNGREGITSGKQLNGLVSGFTCAARTYANVYPAETNSKIELSGTYEV